MHDLKVQSSGLFDQMRLLLLHRILIAYAYAYEYGAVAKRPPYWTKLSRHKWSFSLIYERITKTVSLMSGQHLSWSFEKCLSAQDFLLMLLKI